MIIAANVVSLKDAGRTRALKRIIDAVSDVGCLDHQAPPGACFEVDAPLPCPICQAWSIAREALNETA